MACKLMIRADTPAALRRAVLDAAAAHGASLIDNMSDDDLLEALRDRMGKQGMIVQVEHFEMPAGMEEAVRAYHASARNPADIEETVKRSRRHVGDRRGVKRASAQAA
jgi:hypothetical protein